jgi:hypothetical protein
MLYSILTPPVSSLYRTLLYSFIFCPTPLSRESCRVFHSLASRCFSNKKENNFVLSLPFLQLVVLSREEVLALRGGELPGCLAAWIQGPLQSLNRRIKEQSEKLFFLSPLGRQKEKRGGGPICLFSSIHFTVYRSLIVNCLEPFRLNWNYARAF